MALKKPTVSLLLAVIIFSCAPTEKRFQTIQSQHPEWDQVTVQKLANWEIEIGMTRDMVQAALGKPDDAYTKNGEEIWGYAIWIVTYSSQYKRFVYFVHFSDNKVIRIRGDVNSIRQVS